jgi:hypothetical protein
MQGDRKGQRRVPVSADLPGGHKRIRANPTFRCFKIHKDVNRSFSSEFNPSPQADVDATSVDGHGLSNADSRLASVSPTED